MSDNKPQERESIRNDARSGVPAQAGTQDTAPDIARFRPKVHTKDELKVTLFSGLCKSCGECVVKCPVKCIDWDEKEMGQLGEQAIKIDLDICIGCKTCEMICPDHAVQITDNRKRPLPPKK